MKNTLKHPTFPSDAEILAAREARIAALQAPDMVAMRVEIQELYARAADEGRRAAAYHRHAPSYLGRARTEASATCVVSRVNDAKDYAEQAFLAWQTADRRYHEERARRLPPEVDLCACTPLAASRAKSARMAAERLAWPPIDWGSSHDYAERVRRWRARPERERANTLEPRDVRLSEGDVMIAEACNVHTRDDGSWWEHDAQGIELCRVCSDCRREKLSRYRPEILTGYDQSDVDEPIEPSL